MGGEIPGIVERAARIGVFGDADKLEDGQCRHGLLPGADYKGPEVAAAFTLVGSGDALHTATSVDMLAAAPKSLREPFD